MRPTANEIANEDRVFKIIVMRVDPVHGSWGDIPRSTGMGRGDSKTWLVIGDLWLVIGDLWLVEGVAGAYWDAKNPKTKKKAFHRRSQRQISKKEVR